MPWFAIRSWNWVPSHAVAKIVKTTISGKEVYSVSEGYLVACFDEDIDQNTVTAIVTKKHTNVALDRIRKISPIIIAAIKNLAYFNITRCRCRSWDVILCSLTICLRTQSG